MSARVQQPRRKWPGTNQGEGQQGVFRRMARRLEEISQFDVSLPRMLFNYGKMKLGEEVAAVASETSAQTQQLLSQKSLSGPRRQRSPLARMGRRRASS